MRFIVYGVGAVGGTLAAKLTAGGAVFTAYRHRLTKGYAVSAAC